MSVDWGATGDMLSGIGTISGALAVAVTAYLGRNALNDFKSQRQVERHLQHAEAILTAAYQLQTALDSIRSPLSTASELDESRKELEERGLLTDLAAAKRDRLIQANVFYIRARYFDEDFKSAAKLVPFAAAFFGYEVKDALAKLIHNRHTVRVYADAYARDLGYDAAFDSKVTAAIWKGASLDPDQDEVTKSTEHAVAVLEKHLFPLIRLETRKPSRLET